MFFPFFKYNLFIWDLKSLLLGISDVRCGMLDVFFLSFFFFSLNITVSNSMHKLKPVAPYKLYWFLPSCFTLNVSLSCSNEDHPKIITKKKNGAVIIKFRWLKHSWTEETHRSLIFISCVPGIGITTRCVQLWVNLCGPLKSVNLSVSLKFY